jgi:bifunctional DNA-binding transcriptional regulator/antitoxin component of YhaV-PrlF toxin-antitoxin module
MGRIAFTTTLQARGPAAAVVLDDEQVEAVGHGKKRFPVKATVNGHTWRTTVARMGGEFLVGLNKEVRRAAGAEAGDEVEVVLELDEEERTVEIPPPLAELLAGDDAARAGFDGLSYTHRKEYARWIADAKKPETRDRRLAQALERLREGKPPR